MVYRRARILAAQWNTSLSALVKDFLIYMPQFLLMLEQRKAAEAEGAKALANASVEKTSVSSSAGYLPEVAALLVRKL
jgi:hypothetical protein